MAAAFALKELCTSDRNFCRNFLDAKVPNYLQVLLRQTPGNVPLEVGIMAIDILMYMGGYPDYRKLLVDEELIDSLCSIFEVIYLQNIYISIVFFKILNRFDGLFWRFNLSIV